jgi:hypothetical protein
MVCPLVALVTAVWRLVTTVGAGVTEARATGQPVADREAVTATTSLIVAGKVAAPALMVNTVKLRVSNERTLSPTVNSRRE